MVKQPKFSLIVPVYNVRDYLGYCMESLISQSIKDIEIICVNDGSTDDSLDILETYAAKDNRIRICNKENGGSSSARNMGLDVAEGEYILFVDSDDILEKNACDRLYMEMLQTGADIVVFGAKVFPMFAATRHAWLWDNLHVDLRHYEGDCTGALFWEKASKPFIWNKCFKRNMLEKNKIRFDETLSLGEDNVFLFSVYPKAKQVVYIPDQLYNYRCERIGSLMDKSTRDLEWRMKMHISIIEKILDDWKKNCYIEKYNDELYAWCMRFVGNDLFSMPLKEHEKKVIAERTKKMMKEYGLQLQERNVFGDVCEIENRMGMLVG